MPSRILSDLYLTPGNLLIRKPFSLACYQPQTKQIGWEGGISRSLILGPFYCMVLKREY
jgi:hypothetical protein